MTKFYEHLREAKEAFANTVAHFDAEAAKLIEAASKKPGHLLHALEWAYTPAKVAALAFDADRILRAFDDFAAADKEPAAYIDFLLGYARSLREVLLDNRLTHNSTAPFHNATVEAKREATAETLRVLEYHIENLTRVYPESVGREYAPPAAEAA